MRNGRSKIDIPYLAIFSGILVLVVVASLWLFPEWRESPAQMVLLIGTAVVGLVGLAASFRSAFMPDKKDVPFARLDYDAPNHHRNQENVTARVRSYIEDILPKSLPEHLTLKLGLGSPKDVLGWLQDLEEAKEPSSALDIKSAAEIANIFRRNGRDLLVLGAPGSGKTNVLRELCASLLAQAEADSRQPVPVILNLSTWAQKPGPLVNWIVQEMLRQYGLNKSVTPSWLEADHLVLLLDGLDEVAPNARAGCVQAINAFREYHGAGLVISSRSEDFRELSEKLGLLYGRRSDDRDRHELSEKLALLAQSYAVGIAPLTSPEVERYLSRPELKLTTTRQAIARDKALAKLSTTPLMLTVMVKVFSDRQLDELLSLQDDDNDISPQIYDRYIEQAFVHRPLGKGGYSTAHALRWLRFIAQQLTERDETQLFIEEIQPDWLPFTRRFWTGVIGSLLGIGLVNRMLVVFFEGSSLTLSTSGFLISSIVFGVGLGLFSVLGRVRPVDELVLDFSPRNIGRAFKENLVLIVIFGLMGGFLVDGLGGEPPAVLFGSMMGLLFGILGIQFGNGPIKLLKPLQSNSRYKINQSIHRSAQNTVLAGFLFSMLFSILFYILFRMLGAGSVSMPVSLSIGLMLGMLTGMEYYGGVAVIKHYLLRFLLFLHRLLPLRLIPFLDAMRDRILLQRAGAHYRFIHRTFQEHIAGLTDERIAELTQGERAA